MLKNFDDLKDYLSSKSRMRMQHVYKPVMLLKLIDSGGSASKADIAREFMLADMGQHRDYERKVYPMPGKRLVEAGLVTKEGDIYSLSELFSGLTEAQKVDVKNILVSRVEDYLGLANPYDSNAREYVPGVSRFEVLKRAGGRCQLCGVSHTDRQIDVDHIVPVSKGGSNDFSNLQALCRKCNAQKGNRDATDFRALAEDFHTREPECLFCEFQSGHERIVYHDEHKLENELGYALYDGYAVTKGHTLFISKRHVSDYFELYDSERNALSQLIQKQKHYLETLDSTITGWNVGVNVGQSGGQTVMHVHMHLIPRRDGDITDPKGGVRGVIPSKQKY
jgi:diadenosine tetraphosphate (Ap4A) HIT family hydrolase